MVNAKEVDNKERNILIWIAIINFIGFLYGIYYYSNQISEWDPIYFILIIDCPLQALLVGIVLLGHATKMKDSEYFKFLNNFTSVGAIKYGIWTMFVILFYWKFFLLHDFFTYSILFFAHLGLTLEGFAISGLYKLEIKRNSASHWIYLFIIIGFYLLNDYSDYWIGTHPIIPKENIEIIKIITIFLTILSIAIVWRNGIRKKNELESLNEIINSDFISKFLSLLRNK